MATPEPPKPPDSKPPKRTPPKNPFPFGPDQNRGPAQRPDRNRSVQGGRKNIRSQHK